MLDLLRETALIHNIGQPITSQLCNVSSLAGFHGPSEVYCDLTRSTAG